MTQCRPRKFWLLTTLALATLCAFAPLPVKAQQGGVTRYVYDNNGRLRAVIAPTGEAAIYDYDPAGNFTAIRRLTANDFEVIEFTPREGAIGTLVTIFGVGFRNEVSNVAFNGVNAQITSQTQTSVVAAVPVGATTGPISVTTPRGTRATADPFTVKGVGVAPNAVTLSSGRTLMFTAMTSGLIDPSVTWSVNGVVGGNNTVGTITANGLYAAPNIPNPPDGHFVVRATSAFEPTLFGEAQVIVLSQGGGYDAISKGVSVRYGTPAPPPSVPSFVANGNGVSVRYGTPAPPTSVPTQVFGALSVTSGPVITSVAPGSIARGAAVTVTINGANLSGASNLRFANENGTQETNITASNININANGTSLTATVSVSASTIAGLRIVLVTTPAGTSLSANSGTNTIQIVP